MKKQIFYCLLMLLAYQFSLAGGIVSNTNQSASYVRMAVRDASTEVDAVYYNPAGLIRLSDGFHFSINNQSIFQTKTVGCDLSLLQYEDEFIGDVKAPLFPSVYGAFKLGKLAFSIGFNPVGGGGGAVYEDGLPSFESAIAGYVPLLNPTLGTTTYDANIYFEGTSIYFGLQAGVSYAITDRIGLAVGARYLTASNTYDGYIRDIQFDFKHPLNPSGELTSAYDFFTATGQTTFANAVADKEVDVNQSGSGFAPLVSLHISPIKMIDIAVKYEFKTKLVLTDEVIDNKDGGGIYTDGEETNADVPAYLSVGLAVKPLEKLTVSAGYHLFFEKDVDWDGKEEDIEKNGIEIAMGAEYSLSKKFLVSAGYLYSKPGVTDQYQTDTNYSLPSSAIGFGGAWNITGKVRLNLGLMLVNYSDAVVTEFTPEEYDQSYDKETKLISVGIDFRI